MIFSKKKYTEEGLQIRLRLKKKELKRLEAEQKLKHKEISMKNYLRILAEKEAEIIKLEVQIKHLKIKSDYPIEG